MNPGESFDILPEKREEESVVPSPAPIILTISALSLNFDYVTSDPGKSRADEIKVLLVKNKKPSRKSTEGKPGGFGLPTGQLESKESMSGAVRRETEHETGYSVKRIIGKLFIVQKDIDNPPGKNEIHVHLIESHDLAGTVRERDEIDSTVEPWVTLRQAFEMPRAQNKQGGERNPNGIYFSHLKRLYRAIESMVYCPDTLVDSEAIAKWASPYRKFLIKAMIDLKNLGLLKEFIPEDSDTENHDERASA